MNTIELPLGLDKQTIDRKVSTEEIHGILSEIDTTYNGRLEMSDYLQVNWWLQSGCGSWWSRAN